MVEFNQIDRGDRLNPRIWHPRFVHLRAIRKELQRVLPAVLKADTKLSVLDFGCGNMPYRKLFSEYDVQYVGADIKGNAEAQVIISDDGTIQSPENTYDRVVSTQVLEHVLDPKLYLRECFRVLKHGGKLILSTHGYWKYHPDPTDLWRWTGEGLRNELSQTGFRIDRFVGLLGLAACGFQFIHDALQRRLPRPLQPLLSVFWQPLIYFSDRVLPSDTRNEAQVFLLVATKP